MRPARDSERYSKLKAFNFPLLCQSTDSSQFLHPRLVLRLTNSAWLWSSSLDEFARRDLRLLLEAISGANPTRSPHRHQYHPMLLALQYSTVHYATVQGGALDHWKDNRGIRRGVVDMATQQNIWSSDQELVVLDALVGWWAQPPFLLLP
jgi:hypothetical protein